MKPGDKVTYVTPFESERGIIKSLSDENHVFVVYHCAGEWHRIEDYTAARTNKKDLVMGWNNQQQKE